MKNSLLLFFSLLLSCDSKPEPEPTVTPTPINSSTTGTIKGVVKFEGTPPPNPKLSMGGNAECAALHATMTYDDVILVKDGRLQNALVYVKAGLEKFVFARPQKDVRIVNEGCLYIPRVAGAQTSQPIEFVNNDPAAHNVHGFSSQGDFNFTLVGKGATNQVRLRRPETVLRVKCDLHNWMTGYVGIFSHPFFQVTGPDGSFEFKGLPSGEYDIEVWHEKLGTQTRKVKLDAQGVTDAEFSFKSP